MCYGCPTPSLLAETLLSGSATVHFDLWPLTGLWLHELWWFGIHCYWGFLSILTSLALISYGLCPSPIQRFIYFGLLLLIVSLICSNGFMQPKFPFMSNLKWITFALIMLTDPIAIRISGFLSNVGVSVYIEVYSNCDVHLTGAAMSLLLVLRAITYLLLTAQTRVHKWRLVYPAVIPSLFGAWPPKLTQHSARRNTRMNHGGSRTVGSVQRMSDRQTTMAEEEKLWTFPHTIYGGTAAPLPRSSQYQHYSRLLECCHVCLRCAKSQVFKEDFLVSVGQEWFTSNCPLVEIEVCWSPRLKYN